MEVGMDLIQRNQMRNKIFIATICSEGDEYCMEQWLKITLPYKADAILVGNSASFGSDLDLLIDDYRHGTKCSSTTIHDIYFAPNLIPTEGFAAARNIVLDYARNLLGKDENAWIIFIDSDEVLFSPDNKYEVSDVLETSLRSMAPIELREFALRFRRFNYTIDSDVIDLIHLYPDQHPWEVVIRENSKPTNTETHIRGQFIHGTNGVTSRWHGLVHEEVYFTHDITNGIYDLAKVKRDCNQDYVPCGARCSNFPLVIGHFSDYVLEGDSTRLHRELLYASLIMKGINDPNLRNGTNSYWFTTWYDKDPDKIARLAKEYNEIYN